MLPAPSGIASTPQHSAAAGGSGRSACQERVVAAGRLRGAGDVEQRGGRQARRYRGPGLAVVVAAQEDRLIAERTCRVLIGIPEVHVAGGGEQLAFEEARLHILEVRQGEGGPMLAAVMAEIGSI